MIEMVKVYCYLFDRGTFHFFEGEKVDLIKVMRENKSISALKRETGLIEYPKGLLRCPLCGTHFEENKVMARLL